MYRAWAYYKLVNKFAKAYNTESAANDPGIIIMTEETDIQTPQPKSTVQGKKPYRILRALAEKHGITTSGVRFILVEAGVYETAEKVSKSQ